MTRGIFGAVLGGFLAGVATGILAWGLLGLLLLAAFAKTPNPLAGFGFIIILSLLVLLPLARKTPWIILLAYTTFLLIAAWIGRKQPRKAFRNAFLTGLLSIIPAAFISLTILFFTEELLH